MNAQASVPLFSYGTLQLPEVQRATYGRLLEGRPDVLVGYRLAPLTITDPEVVALSGAAVHTIACRTGDSADRIAGVVYAITPAELEATDEYEVDAYGRVEARLASGATAFVYIGPDAPLSA
jgi:gamma-glutamyl AIG2-like cyclotransferase